ncbi:MAG TPA: zinc ribbon domain-containing protein [Symbiobacteriaceae bacterium]|nr:zinc ribbon domain-containing protein [Symbiobacteriaceae bacterium]
MSLACPQCQAPLDSPEQRFCGQCGQSVSPTQGSATATQAAAVADHVVGAAGKATVMARQAATQLESALMNPDVVGSIPGRSWTLVGAAAVAALVLTGLLSRWISFFVSVGLLWSIIMLIGAAAVAAQEMRNAGMEVPVFAQLPPAIQTWVLHPLIPPVFAGLTALHAFQEARLKLIPIAWVLVAALLLFDQSKKSFQAPEGVGRYLDFRLALRGYRPYLLIGATLCFVALWLTWSKTNASVTGGYESHYSSYYGGYVSEYNFAKNYWPGFEFTGRSLSFATLAELGIVGLVLASLYRGWRALPMQIKYVPLGLCGALLLWCFMNAGRQLGPFLFMAGLALMAGAWFMLTRGEDEGEYDLAHLRAKIKR